MSPSDTTPLREAMKRVAVALKEGDVPFALTGGYAAWVHGAPEMAHDVDFLVAPSDRALAAQVLEDAGLTVDWPSEDWLFKVLIDEVVVDVLHRASSGEDPADLVKRAQDLAVLSVRMPVCTATDVVAEKLVVLDEHYCDFSQVLPVARALREQVDWSEVRRRTRGNPFAGALLHLLETLEVVAAE